MSCNCGKFINVLLELDFLNVIFFVFVYKYILYAEKHQQQLFEHNATFSLTPCYNSH